MQHEARIGAWVVASLCVITFITPRPATTKEHDSDVASNLETMIETIKVSPSPLARAKTAEQLWIFVQHQDTSDLDALDDKVIDDIDSLLRDHVVRQWIARALGRIGKRAIRAVPALKSALKEPLGVDLPLIGVIGPSVRSDAAIRDALQAITGKEAGSGPAN